MVECRLAGKELANQRKLAKRRGTDSGETSSGGENLKEEIPSCAEPQYDQCWICEGRHEISFAVEAGPRELGGWLACLLVGQPSVYLFIYDATVRHLYIKSHPRCSARCERTQLREGALLLQATTLDVACLDASRCCSSYRKKMCHCELLYIFPSTERPSSQPTRHI